MNGHGYHCPTCDDSNNLFITATVSVHLLPDGVDNEGGDTEWDDDSRVDCRACGWSGKVHRLTTKETP